LSGKRKGWLIAFEGIEGAGKSTQIRLAAGALERSGHRVRTTAEPGGTDLGQNLRRLLLEKRDPSPTPLAELFLYLADRTQHVTEVIGPALEAGDIVLSDRFSASTIAYQGHARGLDLAEVTRADAWARLGITPDLNILLDSPVDIGLARARGNDRFHSELEAFHKRVRQGFLTLAAADPTRWQIVDTTQPEMEVHRRVMEALRERLPSP
jgi:dTMP kinase